VLPYAGYQQCCNMEIPTSWIRNHCDLSQRHELLNDTV
jgi:hypothetical protein